MKSHPKKHLKVQQYKLVRITSGGQQIASSPWFPRIHKIHVNIYELFLSIAL